MTAEVSTGCQGLRSSKSLVCASRPQDPDSGTARFERMVLLGVFSC